MKTNFRIITVWTVPPPSGPTNSSTVKSELHAPYRNPTVDADVVMLVSLNLLADNAQVMWRFGSRHGGRWTKSPVSFWTSCAPSHYQFVVHCHLRPRRLNEICAKPAATIYIYFHMYGTVEASVRSQTITLSPDMECGRSKWTRYRHAHQSKGRFCSLSTLHLQYSLVNSAANTNWTGTLRTLWNPAIMRKQQLLILTCNYPSLLYDNVFFHTQHAEFWATPCASTSPSVPCASASRSFIFSQACIYCASPPLRRVGWYLLYCNRSFARRRIRCESHNLFWK